MGNKQATQRRRSCSMKIFQSEQMCSICQTSNHSLFEGGAFASLCMCACVCVCQSTCLCVRAQGQIASQGLKTSAYKVLGAYGDRRWICCSLDGFTLHNKGFPSFFFFHFSSHTLCPLIPAAGVNRYLLLRFNATYGSNISSEKKNKK